MNVYKVVTVRHPNCNNNFTFQVPAGLDLTVGDWVLCSTKTSKIPQVAKCITPSFIINEMHLGELYKIDPRDLQPVIAVLKPTVYPLGQDGEENG